jgi:hypothetical protein
MLHTSLLRAYAALFIAVLATSVQAAQPASCSAASPAHRVALVELYTSEGCDSCPPADNWLSSLERERHSHASGPGKLGDAFVPLALHVDYWDTAQWRDRFAQSAFTERQKALTAAGDSQLVYTPEVFVAGREARNWSNSTSFAERVRQLSAQASPADIRITAKTSAAGRVSFDASFAARGALPADALAYAAVYEDGLQSKVQGGENAGATLHHDQVVRHWTGPVPIVDGHAQISGSYEANPQRGVVAFVQRKSTGEVLQVAELPGCGAAP